VLHCHTTRLDYYVGPDNPRLGIVADKRASLLNNLIVLQTTKAKY